jgi:hypothetical protein
MRSINLDDKVYTIAEKRANLRHLTVDEFISRLVADEVALRIETAGSPGKALMGLFADIPDVMDSIVADAMAARSEPWRLPNDESST